ncbi:MAG: signal recognition particle-docking protein FtsY [Acidobacteria bacterium]|nr:signal recognition particle-docking protein FtsY [Acidobacteriota bacterium]
MSEDNRGWLGRMQRAVARTREQFSEHLDELLRGPKAIPPERLEELEAVLLAADVGTTTTREVLEHLRERLARNELADGAALRAALHHELTCALRSTDDRLPASSSAERPFVIFFVGVNGTGKTTSLAKLTHRWQEQGDRVLLCAADTFRAAAGEQLETWAGRLGCEILRPKPGSDPAAAVFDAIRAAQQRGLDAVFVDTAGRLHTKANLMAELEKMKRTAQKLLPSAPHEILLVLDATTGQNGLAQAREFTQRIGVTGVVLTKIDGTAKGGITIAIARALALPIRYLGTGEQLDDLVEFDAKAFVDSLLAAPGSEART